MAKLLGVIALTLIVLNEARGADELHTTFLYGSVYEGATTEYDVSKEGPIALPEAIRFACSVSRPVKAVDSRKVTGGFFCVPNLGIADAPTFMIRASCSKESRDSDSSTADLAPQFKEFTKKGSGKRLTLFVSCQTR
jgi:hypothetical protein